MTTFLSNKIRKYLSWMGFTVVFVAYRRSDSTDIVGRLYDRLAKRFGIARVIRDVNSIPLGVNFRTYIEQMIPACSVLLVVIGPSWDRDRADSRRRTDDQEDLLRIEVACALKHGVRIIPVFVGGTQIPDRIALPPELSVLASLNGIALRSDPDFHADVDRLLAGL
jgi:TIR domain